MKPLLPILLFTSCVSSHTTTCESSITATKVLTSFRYTYLLPKGRSIVLVFDSTNLGYGENCRFLEFVEQPRGRSVHYTFSLVTKGAIRDGREYRKFRISNFKVQMDKIAL